MPAPHLVTERLRFRPFGSDDEDVLHALWAHPLVRRYLWDDQVVDRDQVREVIAASERDFDSDGFGFWMLLFLDEATVVGFCGFRQHPETAEVELIYGIHPDHWGQGLATEAADGALGHAFGTLGLDEVIAGTDAPNEASIRVLEKLGMRETRRFHRADLPHEQIYYALGADDFLRRRDGAGRGDSGPGVRA